MVKFTATLNDGNTIPMLGLGTWRALGEACQHAVAFALTHGYSHIDTAQAYRNEPDVGIGWVKSGRPREAVFITTKIHNDNQGYEKTQQTFKKSLEKLQTNYIDLLLIHWPNIRQFALTLETWQAMIELQQAGLCKSIGVSNFTIPLLDRIIHESGVTPAVNQVEFHTFLYQKELLAFCQEQHIQIVAYSPIARTEFFGNKRLRQVAEKNNKSVAQIMLAWLINHELVVIPKSVNESRIQENADIFYELDQEDMRILNNLKPQKRLVNDTWAPPGW
jgi:diketogulonate reductase-like aldo/keto reductase